MRIKTAIICLVGAITCSAQESEVPLHNYSLRQCIDYAISHNITVRQSANNVEQSAVDISTAKWARLPNLNGSAGQNWRWGRNSVTETDKDGNQYQVYKNTYNYGTNASLSTEIPLFTGFEIPNQYALAKLNFKAATADLEKAKEDIAIQVASAYLKVLLTQELKQVAINQVELSKEQSNRIVRLFEVGKASPSEVAEAKSRVAQDELSVTQSDNDYQLALLDLSQLLELSNPHLLSIQKADTTFVTTLLTPPDEIYQYAVTNKPEIQAAQYRLLGSEKSIRIAQSGFYPQLNLGGNWGTGFSSDLKNNFGTQMRENRNKSIAFSLSVPLFNRFATRNRVRTARLQHFNQNLKLDNAKKVLYKEIQQAWYNALAAESKYNSSEVAVKASEESFRLMNEKFNNGKATFVEYNEAKLNLTKALSDKLQAKYDYLFRTKILDFYKGQVIE
ncbi:MULTISPECIES: TolC family protein [Bacteroides]|uniref:TolC family protein n=1 Tax=Bacteroides TaxID=816 RepID=UPI00189F2800|nr:MULTISPECIES: TolC family protein [Bacteroides]MDC2614361.1 TolC family protein [Bacteroides ovatus]MDC2633702.1 TolC family protein [Bacteroides ovatus]